MRCKSCGFIYPDPLPIPASIEDHYGIDPQSYWTDSSYFSISDDYFVREINLADGGSVLPQGMEMDYRGGGMIPMGSKEKADDVPARVSKNEFVMTADAVRAAGGGSVNKGAKRMYDLMHNLEARA